MLKEIPLLAKDDIEVRIQQACKGNKALALLYKTSRTDMRILDEVFGVDGWKDDYKEIKGNLYCGISIWDDVKKEWITKWDCGIESQQGDGNERKAEASDAFKRAGTKIGIGRELYTSPQIFLAAETEEAQGGKAKYRLKNPYEKYSVSKIEYNEKKREITVLEIIDSKGNIVFSTVKKPKVPKPQPDVNKTHTQLIQELIKGTDFTGEEVVGYIKAHFGDGLKVKDLNDEQFNQLYSAIEKYLSGE